MSDMHSTGTQHPSAASFLSETSSQTERKQVCTPSLFAVFVLGNLIHPLPPTSAAQTTKSQQTPQTPRSCSSATPDDATNPPIPRQRPTPPRTTPEILTADILRRQRPRNDDTPPGKNTILHCLFYRSSLAHQEPPNSQRD